MGQPLGRIRRRNSNDGALTFLVPRLEVSPYFSLDPAVVGVANMATNIELPVRETSPPLPRPPRRDRNVGALAPPGSWPEDV